MVSCGISGRTGIGGVGIVAKFKVTIWFTDGTYTNEAEAPDSVEAYTLALWDARLASPHGTFYGDVVAWYSLEVVE